MNNTALMYSDIFIPVTRVFTSSKGSAFPLPDDNITANAQYRENLFSDLSVVEACPQTQLESSTKYVLIPPVCKTG